MKTENQAGILQKAFPAKNQNQPKNSEKAFAPEVCILFSNILIFLLPNGNCNPGKIGCNVPSKLNRQSQVVIGSMNL